jgi:flagellar secretion chaperone FliS
MTVTLMDSALARIDQARFATDNSDLLAGAVQIVGELRSTLNVRDGGPFAANLDDLCEYMSRQLVAANLDEVSDLLREIRKNSWMVQSCMTVQIP